MASLMSMISINIALFVERGEVRNGCYMSTVMHVKHIAIFSVRVSEYLKSLLSTLLLTIVLFYPKVIL